MSSPDQDATVRALTAGMRLFGRYRLEAIAGRGGMGVVWRARDDELERTVALKFLPEFVASDPEAARDLKRETKRSLELTHANIVRVFDFLTDGRDAAIAMEFVEGESLATRKANAPGGCLPIDEVAPLARQLCTALAYAHTEAKIVHRDLKPANLLLTPDGRLKITDFGIARSLSESQTRLTGRAIAGTSGTLLYISPQQMGGDKPSPADDIYALGATLYELLAGKPPFYRGDAFSLMKQVAERTPAPIEEHRADAGCEGPPIPAHWNATILACLSKNAADRPASAEEVGRRLAGAESTPRAMAPQPPPAHTAPLPPAPPASTSRATPPPPAAPPAQIAAKLNPPSLPPPMPVEPVRAPPAPAPAPKPTAPAPRPEPPTPPIERVRPLPPQPPPPAPAPAPAPAAPRYAPPPLPPEMPRGARPLARKKKSPLPYILAGVAAVVAVGIWFFGVHLPGVEAEARRAREEMARKQEELERTQREALEQQQRQEAERKAELARLQREAQEQQAKSIALAQQKARVGTLLDSARALDRPESAEQGLQLVARLLEAEPNNAEARALQKKLEAYPRTLKVPGRYRTLADAIDAVRAGDTIELDSGVHDVPGNRALSLAVAVTLRGAGMDSTIIRQKKPASGEPVGLLTARPIEGVAKIIDVTLETEAKSEAERRPALLRVQGGVLEFQRSRVRNAYGDGVWVAAKGVMRATNARFERNVWDGVTVDGADASFTAQACAFESNGNEGISIVSGARGEVANSSANKNGRNGFQASSKGTAKFTGNSASGNGHGGIAILEAGTTGEIIDNEVRESPDNYAAFTVQDGARGIFRDNRALNPKSTGYFIKGGTAVFSKDEVRGGGFVGFQFTEGASCEVNNTVARDCEKSGYLASGKDTKVTLSSAQSLNNSGNGIYARETAVITARSVTVTGNKMTGIYWEDDSKAELRGTNRIEKNGASGEDNVRK